MNDVLIASQKITASKILSIFLGFYIVISGVAKCHWTETRTRETGTGDNRRTETDTISYDGKEVYMNSRTYLFGYQGADSMQIAAGTYKYNFAVELPHLLPATLAGSYGSIEYKVEAILDIPWRFDKEVKVPFTVMRHDNLNDFPELRIPLKQDEVKTFCCLFCQSGPCVISVTLPHGGYAAGQMLPIRIEYANRSNTEIERTHVKLKRTFSYTSSTPETKTKSDTEKITEITIEGCRKGQTNIIDCVATIPGVMINSNARFCRVVQVSYYLEIEGVVGGCHSNPKLQFPITIGSVGIGDVNTFNAVPVAYPNAPGVYPIDPIANVFPNQPPQGVYPHQTSFVPSAPNLMDVHINDRRK